MNYEDFKRLCEAKGITANVVAKATGIDAATFSAWKNGRYTPKREKQKKVADFFGIPLETFDGDRPATEEEQVLRELYENKDLGALLKVGRDLRPEDLQMVVDMAERLRKSYDK